MKTFSPSYKDRPLHQVYIIQSTTSLETFQKQAVQRLRTGEGFTFFHYHRYVPFPCGDHLSHRACNDRCGINDPWEEHKYEDFPNICALYTSKFTPADFDLDFYYSTLEDREIQTVAKGKHCVWCHCDCRFEKCPWHSHERGKSEVSIPVLENLCPGCEGVGHG